MVIGWTWRRPLHHRQQLPSIYEGEDNGDVMAKASEQHNRPEERTCDSRPDRGSWRTKVLPPDLVSVQRNPEDYAQQTRDLLCCSVVVSWSYHLFTTDK